MLSRRGPAQIIPERLERVALHEARARDDVAMSFDADGKLLRRIDERAIGDAMQPATWSIAMLEWREMQTGGKTRERRRAARARARSARCVRGA